MIHIFGALAVDARKCIVVITSHSCATSDSAWRATDLGGKATSSVPSVDSRSEWYLLRIGVSTARIVANTSRLAV
jgi:hypothetical protein